MHLRFPRNIRSFRGHGLVEQDLRARTGEKVLVQHIRRQQDDDRIRVIQSGSMRVSQGSFRRGGDGGGRARGRHHSLEESLN